MVCAHVCGSWSSGESGNVWQCLVQPPDFEIQAVQQIRPAQDFHWRLMIVSSGVGLTVISHHNIDVYKMKITHSHSSFMKVPRHCNVGIASDFKKSGYPAYIVLMWLKSDIYFFKNPNMIVIRAQNVRTCKCAHVGTCTSNTHVCHLCVHDAGFWCCLCTMAWIHEPQYTLSILFSEKIVLSILSISWHFAVRVLGSAKATHWSKKVPNPGNGPSTLWPSQ